MVTSQEADSICKPADTVVVNGCLSSCTCPGCTSPLVQRQLDHPPDCKWRTFGFAYRSCNPSNHHAARPDYFVVLSPNVLVKFPFDYFLHWVLYTPIIYFTFRTYLYCFSRCAASLPNVLAGDPWRFILYKMSERLTRLFISFVKQRKPTVIARSSFLLSFCRHLPFNHVEVFSSVVQGQGGWRQFPLASIFTSPTYCKKNNIHDELISFQTTMCAFYPTTVSVAA